MVYIKKFLLKDEKKGIIEEEVQMWRHQLLDIGEWGEAKVKQEYAPRDLRIMFVMIYSSRESRPGILRMSYNC